MSSSAAAVSPRRPSASSPDMRLVLIVASLGAVLAPLNSTMIAVALPEIRHDFGLSHAAAGWLISGYLIAMAVAQPLGGRLGDQVGRTTVFRAGLIAFFVLSIGATVAPNFALLVSFRVAQAVAGAVLIPNGLAMLRALSPSDHLGRLNGVNGAVLSAAAAAGPLLGAAALYLGSWRLVFPLSMPIVLAALVLLQRLELPSERAEVRTPIDWIGIGLFVALLAGLTLQLSTLREGIDPAMTAIRWVAVAGVAMAFIARQRVTRSPAAEWTLFRKRSFAAATAWVLLTNLTMYTTLLMIPFFVRDVQGKSTQLSGLLLGAMSVLVAIVSPIGGRLSDAFGRRAPALAGAVVALAGSVALLAVMRRDTSPIVLALCLATLGIGLGLGNGPSVTAAVESAPRRMAGAASGTSSMMRYASSIIGAGLLAGVLSSSTSGNADIMTFRLVSIVVVATAALAVAAAAGIHSRVAHEFIPIDEPPPNDEPSSNASGLPELSARVVS